MAQEELLKVLERLIDKLEALEEKITILTQSIVEGKTPLILSTTAEAHDELFLSREERQEQWLQEQKRWYNQMMALESNEQIPLLINKHAVEWKSMEVVGFVSRDIAAADPSYAILGPQRQGRCIAVLFGENEKGENLYAAFPYPLNSYWYEEGKILLDRLYVLEGSAMSLSPKLFIKDFAILGRRKDDSEDPTGFEYFLLHRGYAQVMN